jgi:hypothetical protein
MSFGDILLSMRLRPHVSIGIVVAVMSATAVLGGCAGASTSHARIDDGTMIQLKENVSPSVVEDQLGIPSSESGINDERLLYYGAWRLVFVNDQLKRRVKEQRPTGEAMGDGSRLDREVLELHEGMSIKVVRRRLGTPHEAEAVYEGGSRPEWVYRYGPWEITFRNDVLVQRTKF